jgi:hypothetical protein
MENEGAASLAPEKSFKSYIYEQKKKEKQGEKAAN